jgi:hypothetical protein
MPMAAPNRTNPGRGSAFEAIVQLYFARQGLELARPHKVPIGASDEKRLHKFDLGSDDPPILVECKFHTWTEGGNAPSAKLALWNEAMYYFSLAPPRYRCILAVARAVKVDQSLAEHYLFRYRHMIPSSAEIWEFEETNGAFVGACVYPTYRAVGSPAPTGE